MGLRVERKKIDFWQYFVRTVVETLFWVSSTTIWFFWTFFILLFFWDPSKNCWDLLRKKFGTCVETAFYVHRQTIGRETKFSNEYSSSYLFVTWRGKNLTSDNLVSALLSRLRFWFLSWILRFDSYNFKVSHLFGIWVWTVSIFSWKF